MGFPVSVLSSGSIIIFKQTTSGFHFSSIRFYAATLFSDSQTNPTISRAQATLTLLGCFPPISKRLPFLFNRRKQRSAISINSGAVCARLV